MSPGPKGKDSRTPPGTGPVSSARFARYQAAQGCTSGAGQGARALMAALLIRHPQARNWGIFNCRNTALGNRSAHGEGRALDIGCSVTVGQRMVRDLLEIGPWRLGISVIIHNRRIYSARSPYGRPYGGVPHLDHVHIEMTRKAARRLSLARAKRVLL